MHIDWYARLSNLSILLRTPPAFVVHVNPAVSLRTSSLVGQLSSTRIWKYFHDLQLHGATNQASSSVQLRHFNMSDFTKGLIDFDQKSLASMFPCLLKRFIPHGAHILTLPSCRIVNRIQPHILEVCPYFPTPIPAPLPPLT